MKGKPELIRGSGNLFADLGDPLAATKQLKSQVAADIIAVLDRSGLTVRAGARQAGIDAADLQRIRNADLARFTLDRLVRIAQRLGLRVEITVRPDRDGTLAA